MKRISLLICLFVMVMVFQPSLVGAADTEFESFLTHFDYETRDDMKIDSKSLIPLLASGKAILVDVRFREEVAAWRTGFAMVIPLNELPTRLKELPKNKIIVAACPHKDRSAIAMAYLRSKGYDAKYLTDGLLGLGEYLRGERARDFMEDLDKRSKKQNQTGELIMKIEVLGAGCAKCRTLYEAVQTAVKEKGIDAEIIKTEDIPSIMKYGVMSTPALVIDGKVVFSGKTASAGEIRGLLP